MSVRCKNELVELKYFVQPCISALMEIESVVGNYFRRISPCELTVAVAHGRLRNSPFPCSRMTETWC